MTQVKSERLLNLVIALLVARTYVPKSRLRQVVAGYGDQADDAFERMFERDKEELRELGIPIETGSVRSDPFSDDPGYRIRRADFELPPLELEPDEAAVLGLAARAWQHEGLARSAATAMRKLRAAGIETDSAALAGVEPRVGSPDPSVEPLWQAVIRRQRVGFHYRKQGADAAEFRCLEPWSVMSWRGRWYVVGHDCDRDSARLFRLSRVEGAICLQSEPGAYDLPPMEQARKSLGLLHRPEPRSLARVRLREGTGYGLRRRAAPGGGPVADAPGWDEVLVPYADAGELAEEVAAAGPAAVVVEPPELRDEVVGLLRSVLVGAPDDELVAR